MARLKQLDINGFKSFANPTTFVFDRGITAIIGPNGSGKSNIAEALRWVLGEQQYSNLRSRRTEDVIFGGSDRRGRMGLAEVALTIDNSSGLLPIEFSEVNVTRRAHRSGENQYLINGNRVRLRDVQQLTAPLGQAHTIVGQGLVDAVLSQRPDDRRGLFEHAAGITGLRMQTVSAERGLTEAEDNARRLQDITGELEPRVRSLARRARQAQQYETVRAELTGLQRGYYGALWKQAREGFEDAEEQRAAAATRLTRTEREVAAAQDQLARLRQEERRVASARTMEAERISSLEGELSDTRHRLELIETEAHAAAERAAEQTLARQRVEAADKERAAALADLGQRLATLRAKQVELQADHDRRIAERTALLQRRATLEQDLARLDEERTAQSERLNRMDVELAGSHERAAVLQRSTEELEGRLSQLREHISQHADDLEQATVALASATASVEETRQRRDTVERTLDQLERELRQAQISLDEGDRSLDRLRSRLETLERIWAAGDGLHAGVRAVLRAARRGELDLPGLIGTVAESLDVPSEYEHAIEVALGGHLQDIIVRSWETAAAGIDYLKASDGGRARFQPLDSLHRYQPRRLNTSDNGLIGIATELVNYDVEIATVIEQLLGRTLIAEDLDAAQRLGRASEGWTIVTLQGELVAPAGSVTGGSRSRGAGLLARERERRGLPARISAAEQQLLATRRSLETLQRRQEREVGNLQALDDELQETRNQEREERDRQRHARRELEGEQAALARQQRELEVVRGDLQRITTAVEPLGEERAEIIAARRTIDSQRTQLAATLEALPAPDEVELRELSAALATLQERIRASERERTGLMQQTQRALADTAHLEEEIARIEQRRAALKCEATHLQAARDNLAGVLDEARQRIPPLTDKLKSLQAEIGTVESALESQSRAARECERELDRALLAAARAGDAVELLRSRIQDDLDIADPETLEDSAREASDAVEEEIRRLRERLRRMGSVGEDVIEEHREESERLDYLTSQLGDVAGAAESLRQVLNDLHRQMSGRFSATFEEVAGEFEATFKRLFGGGSARLSHEADGSEPGGIDIIVRPPGKRLQGLNQLSGGERALTAVALLIAIQRVNPSPFCLLDEVDAALDESNVIRFRQELRHLAEDTQYIVITHNRGTIEGADTLYGITMGADSVSRVLSLRLDQAIAAIEDEHLLEVESVI